MKSIFVFGSNLKGIHGAGAAKFAITKRGAVFGKGVGLQGDSYAIPTKASPYVTLRLEAIGEYVQDFLIFAESHPHMFFVVSRIGCGLAGYMDSDIAPMFKGAPANCQLPHGWRALNKEAENGRPAFTRPQ